MLGRKSRVFKIGGCRVEISCKKGDYSAEGYFTRLVPILEAIKCLYQDSHGDWIVCLGRIATNWKERAELYKHISRCLNGIGHGFLENEQVEELLARLRELDPTDPDPVVPHDTVQQ